ncbi:unnamed protein product [Sphenostylis stenocarpa]|uniref:Uncharacterized protein n=1 Tax=Sphenostylis stenocarpa TaxID=92480 RepID=A0AA86SLP1_9FABA|nr:unnamed protein product [Sphenostylis stenocarpa]
MAWNTFQAHVEELIAPKQNDEDNLIEEKYDFFTNYVECMVSIGWYNPKRMHRMGYKIHGWSEAHDRRVDPKDAEDIQEVSEAEDNKNLNKLAPGSDEESTERTNASSHS